MARTRISYGLKTLGLLSALALVMTGLSQCRMIGDPVVGQELSAPQTSSQRSDCIRACADEMKAAQRAETERHKAALRACEDGGAGKECRKSENRLHKSNARENMEDFRACKRDCYNEGAGVAGR